jgi:hypothetical protein
MSLMPPTIVAELELERHGYKVHPMGPSYQAFPEGGSLIIYEDDPARTHEQLAKFSRKDADALPKYNEWIEGIAEVMGPLLTQVPPNIGSKRPSDLLDLAKLAWPLRSTITPRLTADITRLLTMSISDLLDDWFESPQVKGLMAVNGIIGTWAGPCEPGTHSASAECRRDYQLCHRCLARRQVRVADDGLVLSGQQVPRAVRREFAKHLLAYGSDAVAARRVVDHGADRSLHVSRQACAPDQRSHWLRKGSPRPSGRSASNSASTSSDKSAVAGRPRAGRTALYPTLRTVPINDSYSGPSLARSLRTWTSTVRVPPKKS